MIMYLFIIVLFGIIIACFVAKLKILRASHLKTQINGNSKKRAKYHAVKNSVLCVCLCCVLRAVCVVCCVLCVLCVVCECVVLCVVCCVLCVVCCVCVVCLLSKQVK